MCISLDRYFAVLHPLRGHDAQRRGKIMLVFAWVIAAVISLPQVRRAAGLMGKWGRWGRWGSWDYI